MSNFGIWDGVEGGGGFELLRLAECAVQHQALPLRWSPCVQAPSLPALCSSNCLGGVGILHAALNAYKLLGEEITVGWYLIPG